MKYPWKQKILESKKIELLLVALLLLAAIVIRAYHFGAPPIGDIRTKPWLPWMPKHWRTTVQTVMECGIRCILRLGVPAR